MEQLLSQLVIIHSRGLMRVTGNTSPDSAVNKDLTSSITCPAERRVMSLFMNAF